MKPNIALYKSLEISTYQYPSETFLITEHGFSVNSQYVPLKRQTRINLRNKRANVGGANAMINLANEDEDIKISSFTPTAQFEATDTLVDLLAFGLQIKEIDRAYHAHTGKSIADKHFLFGSNTTTIKTYFDRIGDNRSDETIGGTMEELRRVLSLDGLGTLINQYITKDMWPTTRQ